jgi:hypothetical protein
VLQYNKVGFNVCYSVKLQDPCGMRKESSTAKEGGKEKEGGGGRTCPRGTRKIDAVLSSPKPAPPTHVHTQTRADTHRHARARQRPLYYTRICVWRGMFLIGVG